jgi:hypothetical protein
MQDLVATYGAVGLAVYLTSTCLVYVVFLLGIQAGWKPSGIVAGSGVWVAAYLGTKITQPFRIVGAMAITPLLTRTYARLTGRRVGERSRTS